MNDILDNTELLCSCSSKETDWNLTEMIASRNDNVIPFFGTHPWYADSYTGPEKLEEILSRNMNAGIGEIGLDYKKGCHEEQRRVFTEQLSIAEKLDRPVSIHMVASEADMLRILRHIKTQSILHSFSGPISYIRPFTDCGCYFSLSPRIVNKSYTKLKALVQSIPHDRLLIESDAPNNSASIEKLIQVVAPMLSITEEDFISMTAANLRRFLP